MTRKEILDNAARIVGGKDGQHGDTEDNFSRIARLWYAYKGVPFTAKDVAVMMILLKVARIASGHQCDDNFVDIAGYAACGGELDDPDGEATMYECFHCEHCGARITYMIPCGDMEKSEINGEKDV